ncbi:MAG: VOC family protein [Desulfobacteraceae bacterium]|nr:MAG: VOC family protein [Desulfobacteraceae bacterium]
MTIFNVRATNTILYCRNWQATVRFYREVLGLAVHHALDWFVEFQVTPDSFISVADAARATIAGAQGQGLTLAWQVDELDALHRHLMEAGVAVGPIHSRWGARVFYFHDPEGHRLEAWSGK